MRKYHITIEPYTLHFRKPARTSRGIYLTHKVWYVRITSTNDPFRMGVGECAPLPGLSCDDVPDYEERLKEACKRCEVSGKIPFKAIRNFPSIIFGLETALLNYERGNFALFETPFSKGLSGILINGLIWMGPSEEMVSQVEQKLAQGYKCVKIKIGSLDFQTELNLLKWIRLHHSKETLTLRVDANGAFTAEAALDKLKGLSGLDIHSIEQPIKAGQWQEMARLAALSPIPIALDEELIGWHTLAEKRTLLETIQPQYLVLKPTLHGGLEGCMEWIRLADERKIGWWITSALESNIGLNAIAQWSATLNNPLHQGLGTGQLYTDNIDLPLSIKGEQLWFEPTDIVTTPPIKDLPLFSEYVTDRTIQTITLEGITYTWPSLQQMAVSHPETYTGFHSELIDFLRDWFNSSSTININTSGSTGTPTLITVQKSYLVQSACLTCSYFRLKPGDPVLLCLPLDFIAGKMMVIRSLVGKLNLYLAKPGGHPLKKTKAPFSFVSMIPMQVFNTLQVADELDKLRKIKILLIGGGPVDQRLETALQEFPNEVYVSYGMTETLSHIALRRVTGDKASLNYRPLPSVSLSLSESGCLIIDAPLVSEKRVLTNDLAEIFPDGSFRLLGRIDNTVVTGGLKVQIEALEEIIGTILSVPFGITSLPDAKFGEIIVLITEEPFDDRLLTKHLPSWQVPKRIIQVPELPRTKSGKLDRQALKRLATSY